ncbi:DNA polymerase IV, partial [Bacillus atrophaeus]|nr:DNA polymerase IV [Bacillus atrophaeus]
NWKTITRSMMLKNPIDQKNEIMQEAENLFFKHWSREPVRLLGITGTDLVEKEQAYKQLDLFSFTEDAKDEPIQQMMEKLNQKFGSNMIKKGAKVKKKESKTKGTSFNKDFFQDEKKS